MMNKEQILRALHAGVVQVTFTKKDGTERVMECTLKEDMLPAQVDIEEAIQKKKPNPDVLAVWDVEKEGWRSFRWDSVTAWVAGA
jgi:hypothetical protein